LRTLTRNRSTRRRLLDHHPQRLIRARRALALSRRWEGMRYSRGREFRNLGRAVGHKARALLQR